MSSRPKRIFYFLSNHPPGMDTFTDNLSKVDFYFIYFFFDSVRWTAPELLHDNVEPTLESDRWSFGMVLWQIMAHGQIPFADKTDEEVQIPCSFPRETISSLMSSSTHIRSRLPTRTCHSWVIRDVLFHRQTRKFSKRSSAVWEACRHVGELYLPINLPWLLEGRAQPGLAPYNGCSCEQKTAEVSVKSVFTIRAI